MDVATFPDRWLLYPMLALVVLTFVVGVAMYRRRVSEMKRRRIPPQSVASATAMATTLEDTGAADNFRNLFETPVLFYAGMIVAYAAKLGSPALLALAWAYVLARGVHSAIHCTTNRVMHRFKAFLTSFGLLGALWAVIAWELLVAGRG
jgi:hypothetical protein